MTETLVHIVLPTFNGARYLANQIESLQRQTHTHWRLLVRDDGSADATLEVVSRFAESDPRIELLASATPHLGCVGNVGRLLEAAMARDARYVMLADQDDVWLPDKIAASLAELQAVEREIGADTPAIVHTDLVVVDAQLQQIHPSFMRYERIYPESSGALRTLFVQNFVTGCTAIVNRALLQLALPISSHAPMHDWWLALCAAAGGRIRFLPRATVLYRQHEGNVLAYKGYVPRLLPWRTSWSAVLARGNRSFALAVCQTAALRDRLIERRLAPEAVDQMVRFATLFETHVGPVHRLWRASRLGLRSQHPLRTALLYVRLGFGLHRRIAAESPGVLHKPAGAVE